jgi:hypothetical protein
MNIQQPLTYSQAIPIIACAIYCCDTKEKYHLVQRPHNMDCARLGTKKHSCVLHKLRKTDKHGKMTTDNKYNGIQASPRYPPVNPVAIPDIQVGSQVID